MHAFSHTPGHHAPATDAEIDAAVGAFVAELTGTSQPIGAAAQRYQRALETIAEEVTELLAALASRCRAPRTPPGPAPRVPVHDLPGRRRRREAGDPAWWSSTPGPRANSAKRSKSSGRPSMITSRR